MPVCLTFVAAFTLSNPNHYQSLNGMRGVIEEYLGVLVTSIFSALVATRNPRISKLKKLPAARSLKTANRHMRTSGLPSVAVSATTYRRSGLEL